MSDDAVDYGGTSDSDTGSESDKVSLSCRTSLQTSMGDDILVSLLQMIVCLRDGKEAEHWATEGDVSLRLGGEQRRAGHQDSELGEFKLALQHQASAQHQHPKPKPDVVVSSSDPASSGDSDDSHRS